MPSVLIVDDDPDQLVSLKGALRGENLEIDTATSGQETFEVLSKRIPDLVLLDLALPDEHGFDVLRSIRVEPHYDAIPVVFISATDDIDTRVKGLDLGAVEFLVKPLHPTELAARVRALVRQKLKLDQLFEEYKRLSELSLTDPLTGAYNRRALDTFLKARLAESSRHDIPVSCLMFDIDHFKNVNDSHGHDGGDRVLKEVTHLVRVLCRQEDAVIRYGGEEFLIMLLHTSREGAAIFGERLRENVESHDFRVDGGTVKITISAGISSHPEDLDAADPEQMIKRADNRLYQAKHDGRNKVVYA